MKSLNRFFVFLGRTPGVVAPGGENKRLNLLLKYKNMKNTKSKEIYTVFIDDYFHEPIYDDKDRIKYGEFETYEEAVCACKKIVENFLASYNTEKDARLGWYHYGEDAFIRPTPEGIKYFSARDYFHECVEKKFGSK